MRVLCPAGGAHIILRQPPGQNTKNIWVAWAPQGEPELNDPFQNSLKDAANGCVSQAVGADLVKFSGCIFGALQSKKIGVRGVLAVNDGNGLRGE